MPVYNAAPYLKECIDSILAQTYKDFELLIVDDGSTDSSAEIAQSYEDERIRFIQNEHDYIGSLNIGLNEARGKYIARMDADDVMMPDRLQIQYAYMEAHPEIGILGTMAKLLNRDGILTSCCTSNSPTILTKQQLLYSNPILHPTTFIRKSIIEQHQLNYDKYSCYAEDYHLWCNAIMHGIKIGVIPFLGISYRIHQQQVTNTHQKTMKRNAEKIQGIYSQWLCKQYNPNYKRPQIQNNKNKALTVIIPFLNEGQEVVNTVKSIRNSVGEQVDIIVINDQSTDELNYPLLLNDYNVYYILNYKRKGVAASRDLGIKLCKTRFFLLLDAHMRLYNDKWLNDIISILEKDERLILCAQTKQLWRKDSGEIEELNRTAVYGAYARLYTSGLVPSVDWNYYSFTSSKEELEPIACILGAGYAASKHYWQYLKGLHGLEQYGSDEMYISTKAWLEGGKCLLLKKHSFGHIYRNKAPYQNHSSSFVYNHLLIAYTLFPQGLWLWVKTCCRITNTSFDETWALFMLKHKAIEKLKKYYETIFTVPIKKILEVNQKISYFNTNDYHKRLEVADVIHKTILQEKFDNYGIIDGQMSKLLWECLYHHSKQKKVYCKEFYILFPEIKDAVKNHKLPLNFKYGICGIGWAVIYLYSKGLINDIDEDLLVSIDKEISSYRPVDFAETDFYTGAGGILAYVVCREAYNLSRNIKSIFPYSWSMQLVKVAHNIINKRNEIPSHYYAELFLCKENIRLGQNFSPELQHWSNIPESQPQKKKYWTYSFDGGCLGYTIPALFGRTQSNN